MENKLQLLDLASTGQFPDLLLDYLAEKPELRSFYSFSPSLAGLENAVNSRKFEGREVLVQALEKQYAHLGTPASVSSLLNQTTFTVTTGHQLNIFTGPLYVIYKIITTIRLAETLKSAFPQFDFVPVYWMATEDHDFAEIASFTLFGKKYTWETEQTGAVGRMNPRSIQDVLSQLPEALPLFEKAYLEEPTLARAVRRYMHELFGARGLVVVDGDDPLLKKALQPAMMADVFEQVTQPLVQKATEALQNAGYKTVIHPREINFFYLIDGLRARIIQEHDHFLVLGTDIRFTDSELKKEIEDFPERFSPNVVLRPLYQELILPNLAYIGGPSEVPYWLQLKPVFDLFQVDFPVLLPRNFAMLIPPAQQKKMVKLGVEIDELFDDAQDLKKRFLERISDKSLSLAFEVDEVNEVLQRIASRASEIDPTLVPAVEAEQAKIVHQLANLEKRIKKAEERHHETAIQQVLGLQEKLFPGGNAQERVENFFTFGLQDAALVDDLFLAFNPLDFRLVVMYR